jgi:hypothetical protein
MKFLKRFFSDDSEINPEDNLPRIPVEDVLSIEQARRANEYYINHKGMIDKMIKTTKKSYEPSQPEDLVDPSIWKAEYWRWFFNV